MVVLTDMNFAIFSLLLTPLCCDDIHDVTPQSSALGGDYSLWEVIEYGNSWVPIPITAPESGPSTALKMTVPSTTEEKICKKNDSKSNKKTSPYGFLPKEPSAYL
ncbi:hypothetical protein Tco_1458814 [Tanacetum coccineum]